MLNLYWGNGVIFYAKKNKHRFDIAVVSKTVNIVTKGKTTMLKNFNIIIYRAEEGGYWAICPELKNTLTAP